MRGERETERARARARERERTATPARRPHSMFRAAAWNAVGMRVPKRSRRGFDIN
jgi:hypothetical protein